MYVNLAQATSVSDAEAQYRDLVEKIQEQLRRQFSGPSDPRLSERRSELKRLFNQVSVALANTLYQRLQSRDDPLAKDFRGRLSTPARYELLGILKGKSGATGGQKGGGRKFIVRHPYWPENIVRPAVVDLDKAMRLNRYYSKKLGWGTKRKEIEQRLIKALNWPAIMGENGWAMAVANWQMRQMGLSVDGVIGPKTWRRLQVLACQAYEPGEAAKSQSERGHLSSDVMMFKGSLLIADFGVNQSRVKSSTQLEKLLQEWLKKFETADPPYDLIILGFSDCVGAERDNEALRKARAAAVLKLLGPRARSGVAFVGSARKDAYITDENRNVSVRERAMNRSVFIQFKRDFDYEPEVIKVKPPTLREIIDNCKRLLDRQRDFGFNIDPEQVERLKCMYDMLAYPEVDDRYIGEAKWMNGGMYLWQKVSPGFLESQFITHMRENLRRLHPSIGEKAILQNIALWNEDMLQGIMRKAKGLQKPMGGGSSVSPGDRQIYDWISAKQRDPKSIYSGFTHGCQVLTTSSEPLPYPWLVRRIP